LFNVVPWQLRRPAVREVTLLHDAELQIMLRELRYASIRRSCGSSDEGHRPAGSRKRP
jgi:hypothetical protein